MFVRYQSDYPNQVHQLIVSVSKHLYITARGEIRFQKKAFDVSLDKIGKLPKEHLVHYLLRDHYSGAQMRGS